MSWLTNRFKERTSWDGIALIGVGLVILFLGNFVTWAAYAAILYGAWTLMKYED
tara:strand:+ start:819 stop:980 length:162 start_codon:yes stop_codon:yes gene_type:complete